MKALCWYGKNDVRVETVPEPKILNPRDAILKTTLCAICGSDLHLLHGCIPTMKPGDILGHEFIGEVLEVGSEVSNLKKGDRVVTPFVIACGRCWFCQEGLTSLCDNSNPNAEEAEKLYGHSTAGLFGYSHIFGGYPGGQAQYVRVPFADTACCPVPESVTDEQALFLSDIFPTGYMAAENCNIQPGDTIAIWGCGPVGQLAIKSAFLLGAERVIAIDDIPERLELAEKVGKSEVLNFGDGDVVERLTEMTAGRGPDGCIDAVGMEAHGASAGGRPHVLRQAIQACRKGGSLSVPGVYGGSIDKFPMGAAFSKGLTLRMGQTNVHRYMKPLLDRIEKGEIDPSFVITDRYGLDCAPEAYRVFDKHEHGCIKVVLKP